MIMTLIPEHRPVDKMTIASTDLSNLEPDYAESKTEVEDGGAGRAPDIIKALRGQSQSLPVDVHVHAVAATTSLIQLLTLCFFTLNRHWDGDGCQMPGASTA